jgi:Cytochrome bd-type quinol oxidase, subunit 2
MTTVFAVLAFLFFGFKYPYHLHYTEQLSMFLFTGGFFSDVVAVPGGLADYLARFFVQFFYYAWAGAGIIAVLLVAIQLLSWRASGDRGAVAFALSFLPAIFMWFFLLDENAMLDAPVALVLSLAAALLVRRIKGLGLRRTVELISVPLLFFLLGSLAVVFVLVVIADEWRSSRGGLAAFSLAAVALIVLCPVIAHQIWLYPLKRFFMGIHYNRYHHLVPLWLWVSAISAAAVAFIGGWKAPSGVDGRSAGAGEASWKRNFALVGIFLALAAGSLPAMGKFADSSKEETMKYMFMCRWRMWNRIMMTADVKSPSNPVTVSIHNLALAMSGRMQDNMFEYFQNGPQGLLPEFVRDHTSPIPTAEIYWQLGMVNTAQRFIFEAQEAIPDFQKSARCYQRLAETNIVNGDYEVAGKYIEALKHTLFYRGWAKSVAPLLGDDDAVAAHPEYGRIRRLRLKDHDFMYSDKEMDSMLGLLFVENHSNTMAYEYLMSWCLLNKNLDRFAECFQLVQFDRVPKAYQEALLLYWTQSHGSFEGLPPVFSQSNIQRMNSFISAQNSGKDRTYLEQNFGDTYWYYYLYRYQ